LRKSAKEKDKNGGIEGKNDVPYPHMWIRVWITFLFALSSLKDDIENGIFCGQLSHPFPQRLPLYPQSSPPTFLFCGKLEAWGMHISINKVRIQTRMDLYTQFFDHALPSSFPRKIIP
jgi:hypothetical protein